MLNAKIVTAGPRGNACRECKEKVKKPDVVLKVSVYNQYSNHPKVDNYCSKCGVNRVEKALVNLKDMLDTLTNGPTKGSQIGNKKVRVV
jgi:hypothetical protein